MKNQIKGGAIVSYFNILLNMGISIFFTPFLISSLGVSEYGVYRIVQSFSGQLSIMSFGVATLIVRNLVFYETKKQKEEKENFLFFALVVTYLLAMVVLAIGTIMFFMLDGLYSKSMLPEELMIAKKLFILLIFNIAITIICDAYIGIIKAHERFVIAHGSQTLKLIVRIVAMIILLNIGVGSVGIVLADCMVSISIWFVVMLYGRVVLKERARFHYVDKKLIFQSAVFSAAIFLQAIVNQVNQNLDNVILGILTNTATVAMYSLALSLFTAFNSLVSVIGSLFTPKATRLVAENADGEKLTDFVIKPGRIQLMMAGLAITGFVLFGKNFIYIWVGEEYQEIYWVTIVLLIPATLPLIESVCTSILDALLKRMGCSIILLAMCVINVAVSIVLVKRIGYMGAAVGTASSYVVGYGIMLNLYIKKVVNLNIKRMFRDIFQNILKGISLSIIVGIPIALLPNTVIGFIIKVSMYCLVYGISMYLISMNSLEKKIIKNILKH